MRSIQRASGRLALRSATTSHPSIPPAASSIRLMSSTTTTQTPATTSSTSSSSQAQPPPPIRPITSLLIANRGEIALRIQRTATRLGIPTTTIYTDVDRHAQHILSPTSTPISLGADPAAYLDGERISLLAATHNIDALHPGYGFLSENAAFATLCAERGIRFVGPPPQAMTEMGDKARSKELMNAAGVPCVPGYHGPEQSVEFLAERAAEIEYPVLLKSVRGGGGKGMRIVSSASEFESQLRSARQEARASFGPEGEVMLVEKYISRPRHVEVQIFADAHSNCVALGERDCSVQRRHQKILEESPAPLLPEHIRQDLYSKARTAALAVGYVGAGTVEFILDRDTDRFYFMEMNTRLQVEHPVSEMVTGTDLVEWQLRVAAGEPLPLTQEEIEGRMAVRGHAVEARIYAESPERGFVPDSGPLLHLRTPSLEFDSGDNCEVRIDAGFAEGDTVSQAYDGMIAKLIVRGPDRETALRKMCLALQSYEVAGLATNIEFLKRLCSHQAFVEGDLDTGFIDRHREELFKRKEVGDEVFVQAALGSLVLSGWVGDKGGPHGETLGFGEAGASTGERRFAFRVTDEYASSKDSVVEVGVTQTGQGVFSARVSSPPSTEARVYDNIICLPSSSSAAKATLTSLLPHSRITTTIVRNDDDQQRLTIFQAGSKTELVLAPPNWFAKALGTSESKASVVAPMPCKILRNEVGEGDRVEKGAPLVVIESMKMETVIRSPQDGVIKRLAHKQGDICKAGTVLVLFEEEAAEE